MGIKALSNNFAKFNLSKVNLAVLLMSSILIDAKNQSSISLACLKQFDNILSTALLLLLEVMKGLKEVVNELYSSTLTSFFMVTIDEKVGATCDTHVLHIKFTVICHTLK